MDWRKEAQYLKDELERREYEAQRERDAAYQQREAERLERQREWQESQCYANSWEDAFRKAIPRYRHEANDEKQMIESGDYPGFEDNFFQNELEQTEYALKLYNEEMAKAQAIIAKIKQRARNRVAARVEEKYPDAHIAQYLRDDDYSSLVEW